LHLEYSCPPQASFALLQETALVASEPISNQINIVNFTVLTVRFELVYLKMVHTSIKISQNTNGTRKYNYSKSNFFLKSAMQSIPVPGTGILCGL